MKFKFHELSEIMNKAKTYENWAQSAQALDDLLGRRKWKNDPVSQLYDYQRIYSHLVEMRSLREKRDIKGLKNYLRCYLQKNIYGVSDPELFSVCYLGTKKLIEEY